MEAILASPSQFSPSLSPTNSSPGSPLLPALSSPFDLTSLKALSPQPTPTKVNSVKRSTVPSWMTDELDEEWVMEEDSQAKGEGEGGEEGQGGVSTDSVVETPRKSSAISNKSNNSIKSTSSIITSLNKPRIPSSLRYALASHSNLSSNRPPHHNPSPGSENQSPTSSSAGTFVMRSTPGNSYRAVGGENQLQAAARALRGAQGGLGAPSLNEGEGQEVAVAKTPGKDRLGLMSLFERASPPAGTS